MRVGRDLSSRLSAMIFPKAAVKRTMSIAVNDSPGLPPIVPLIPEILLINATKQNLIPKNFGRQKYGFHA
jgi:hypothetical protein